MWIHVVSVNPNYTLDAELAELVARRPRWRFTVGDEPPPDAGYEVLVAAVPSRELLVASPKLHTVQLPFSGVPAATREAVAEFPRLRIRSLHHNAGPTAELALGLVLAAARALVPADQDMRRHDWTTRFVPPSPTMLLDGHGATVAGYGHIGRRVARGLAALGMRVRATRASATTVGCDDGVEVHPAAALPRLLPDSRVLVLTLPSTAATTELIGATELDLLPSPATLVNVSRAAIVDEAALYRKLRGGELAAGLDVWWDEAGSPDAATDVTAAAFPFHELPNVVLSPHRGGAFSLPESARLRAAHLEEALDALAAGK